MAKRPINSTKNVVDSTGALVAGVVTQVNVSAAVDSAVLAASNQVERGSTINGLFLSLFIESGAAAGVSNLADWFICKNPGANLVMPNPGATGVNDNKKFIMHEEKGLAGSTAHDGIPMVFKGVVVIPRGYRRQGAQDEIQVHILSPVNGLYCLKAIYKWYK